MPRVSIPLTDGEMHVTLSPDADQRTVDALTAVGEAALQMMKEQPQRHALQMKTNRAVLGWCAWAHMATCECGESQKFYATRKRARKWYYNHRGGK